MGDLEQNLLTAWHKIRPTLLANPTELAKRLARQKSISLLRPPRAWCLALRASDSRLGPSVNSPRQTIPLNAPLLRELCSPIRIESPGELHDEIARSLGTTPVGLRNARIKKILPARCIPRLA